MPCKELATPGADSQFHPEKLSMDRATSGIQTPPKPLGEPTFALTTVQTKP